LKNGEFRLLLASTGVNHPFQPIGVGVNSSGEKIGEELTTLIDTTHLEVLFADGEPGIEALLLPGMRFSVVWFRVGGTFLSSSMPMA